MNAEQLYSLLRTILQIAGTVIVARGWADADTVAQVGGAVITLAVTGWGLYARRSSGLVASVAALPAVAEITTTSPDLADAVPSRKVRPV